MDEKTYKITLADGRVIDNLKLNGNNFISKEVITSDIFDYNCSPVVISDGVDSDICENMELVQITKSEDDEYWFVLREITDAELKTRKIESDIAYLAMMSGVEL